MATLIDNRALPSPAVFATSVAAPLLKIMGSTSGAISMFATGVVTPYNLNWPLTQGGSSTVLTNDGAGNLSWGAGGGGSGVTTLAAIGSTPNANAGTISGTTLNLQPADGTFGGVVTTAAQTFAGAKTFASIFSPIFSSTTANAAASGILRLANTNLIAWRNAANSADVSLALNASDNLELSAGGFTLNGSTSGQITIFANATTTNYSIFMPATQGGASSVLTNDGAGNLSWGAGGGGGSPVFSGLKVFLTTHITGYSPVGTGFSMDTLEYTTGSDVTYNLSNGQFTFVTTGKYRITVNLEAQNITGTIVGFDFLRLQLVNLTGTTQSPNFGSQPTMTGAAGTGYATFQSLTGTVDINATAGSTAVMVINSSGGFGTLTIVNGRDVTGISVQYLGN